MDSSAQRGDTGLLPRDLAVNYAGSFLPRGGSSLWLASKGQRTLTKPVGMSVPGPVFWLPVS